jgi:hypothetical protein
MLVPVVRYIAVRVTTAAYGARGLSETCGDYKQIFFSLNTITEETFHFAIEIKFSDETNAFRASKGRKVER